MPSPGEDVQSWSKTALDNATADPLINWAEGMPRAEVNNSARSMQAAIAKSRDLRNGSIVTTGSANAQEFISGVGYTTVPTGLRVMLKIGATLTNTDVLTLNMDAIGAAAVNYPDGTGVSRAGTFTAGSYAELIYSGADWILLGSIPATAVEAAPPGITQVITTIITVPTATLDFNDIDDSFTEYMVSAVNVVPQTNVATLLMQVSEDGGATFKAGTSDYRYAVWTVNENGTAGAGGSGSVNAIRIFSSQTSLATRGASFELRLFGPSQTTGWKVATYHGTNGVDSIGMYTWLGSGCYWGSNNAINAIRFFFDNGNIASGTFTLLGVR